MRDKNSQGKRKAKILLDTNVILDLVLKRENYYEDVKVIFDLIVNDKIEGYICANILSDIYYIIRKYFINVRDRKDIIRGLINIFNIIDVRKMDVICAIKLVDMEDFEDAIQYQCAVMNNLDYLVTRNEKDYKNCSKVKIINPKNLVQKIS